MPTAHIELHDVFNVAIWFVPFDNEQRNQKRDRNKEDKNKSKFTPIKEESHNRREDKHQKKIEGLKPYDLKFCVQVTVNYRAIKLLHLHRTLKHRNNELSENPDN